MHDVTATGGKTVPLEHPQSGLAGPGRLLLRKPARGQGGWAGWVLRAAHEGLGSPLRHPARRQSEHGAAPAASGQCAGWCTRKSWAEARLVLGGGGVTGIAWETGLIAGLAELGIDLAAADVIVGTSAGSVAGADLTSGQELEALYPGPARAACSRAPGPRGHARHRAQRA